MGFQPESVYIPDVTLQVQVRATDVLGQFSADDAARRQYGDGQFHLHPRTGCWRDTARYFEGDDQHDDQRGCASRRYSLFQVPSSTVPVSASLT